MSSQTKYRILLACFILSVACVLWFTFRLFTTDDTVNGFFALANVISATYVFDVMMKYRRIAQLDSTD